MASRAVSMVRSNSNAFLMPFRLSSSARDKRQMIILCRVSHMPKLEDDPPPLELSGALFRCQPRDPLWRDKKERDKTMLGWALTFLVIAIIAAIFGFAGIAATASSIAQILFVVFLALFLV